MMKDFGLQLKICRETAGFTQEMASSLLHISVRTLGSYESGANVPDDIVFQMIKLYDMPVIGYEWLRNTKTGRLLLPDIESRNLPETILCLLVDLDTADKYTMDLINIGQDGKVDAKEQPLYCRIVENLKPILKTVFSLNFYKKKKLTSTKPASNTINANIL